MAGSKVHRAGKTWWLSDRWGRWGRWGCGREVQPGTPTADLAAGAGRDTTARSVSARPADQAAGAGGIPRPVLN